MHASMSFNCRSEGRNHREEEEEEEEEEEVSRTSRGVRDALFSCALCCRLIDISHFSYCLSFVSVFLFFSLSLFEQWVLSHFVDEPSSLDVFSPQASLVLLFVCLLFPLFLFSFLLLSSPSFIIHPHPLSFLAMGSLSFIRRTFFS